MIELKASIYEGVFYTNVSKTAVSGIALQGIVPALSFGHCVFARNVPASRIK